MSGPLPRRAPRLRPAAAPPRVVLLWIIIIIVAATAAYLVAPRVLPARIVEGPLVQMTAADGATLVWYTSRPADCTVHYHSGTTEQKLSAESDGRRQSAHISGLQPATACSYQIFINQKDISDEFTFRTAPPVGADKCRFIVFGDSGRGTKAQYDIAADMTRTALGDTPVDFLLHTGDLVYNDGERSKYSDRFFTPYRHMLARMNFWPCAGNHDLGNTKDAAAYREVFDIPNNGPPGLPAGLNYWFDYANCRFVVIDSNVAADIMRDVTAPWLSATLQDCPATWKFVALHHPPYTGGKYAPDLDVQRNLVPVFEQVGVDLVFCGHDHSYQRTSPIRAGQIDEAGIIYIISAAGGARLYQPRGKRPDYIAVHDWQHYSFTTVDVTGPKLALRQHAPDAGIIDELTIEKPAMPESQPATPTTQPINTAP